MGQVTGKDLLFEMMHAVKLTVGIATHICEHNKNL
jgi:hypothetical protein